MEGLMAQKGLWNLAEEKIIRERGELPNEEGDAVREHKAMHKDNFLNSCSREYEVKNKGRRKWRGERREPNGGELEEDVKVLFRWRPVKSSVKGETSLERTCGISVVTCLIVNLMRVRLFVWCPM